jgi:hypothetical protein
MDSAVLKIKSLGTKLLVLWPLLLWSCSSPPIHRDDRGLRVGAVGFDTFAPMRKRIALLPLFNEGPYGDVDLETFCTEELREELGRTQNFIIDPMDAKIFGSSKEVFSGGGFKLSLMAQKAKLSGINFVLYGRILFSRMRQKTDEIGFVRQVNSYAEVKIELRIFDISSSKEIWSREFMGEIDDSNFHFLLTDPNGHLKHRQELLKYAAKISVKKSIGSVVELANKLDWTGRVAKIEGTKIYINAGRRSGIHIGDILKVLTAGNEIFDPETGALIGVSKGQTKGTIEIMDYFGIDGALASLHSGGTIDEGDFVQLY